MQGALVANLTHQVAVAAVEVPHSYVSPVREPLVYLSQAVQVEHHQAISALPMAMVVVVAQAVWLSLYYLQGANMWNFIKTLLKRKLQQGIYFTVEYPLFKNKENKHGKSKHRSIK